MAHNRPRQSSDSFAYEWNRGACQIRSDELHAAEENGIFRVSATISDLSDDVVIKLIKCVDDEFSKRLRFAGYLSQVFHFYLRDALREPLPKSLADNLQVNQLNRLSMSFQDGAVRTTNLDHVQLTDDFVHN